MASARSLPRAALKAFDSLAGSIGFIATPIEPAMFLRRVGTVRGATVARRPDSDFAPNVLVKILIFQKFSTHFGTVARSLFSFASAPAPGTLGESDATLPSACPWRIESR